MKIKPLLFPLVLLITLLAACSNSSKEYDLAGITQLFEDAELHLKPQAGDDYPTIMNVNPAVYELLDDALYIYMFESEKKRIEALEELNVEESFSPDTYEYSLKNALIVYVPLSPADVNFDKQIRDIVQAEEA
ncbi:hypothetical protein ACX93W_15595 [Paenibacillus sp. CAU 1782]